MDNYMGDAKSIRSTVRITYSKWTLSKAPHLHLLGTKTTAALRLVLALLLSMRESCNVDGRHVGAK